MVTLQAFCEYLNNLLQPKLFTDYCPNGLQIEGAPAIFKCAYAVSASLEVIEEAARNEVQALLVHHGIFWNRDSYIIEGVKRKKIAAILKANINLIAYHLPLDAHQEFGNNWKAAMELGWTDLKPFCINGIPIGVKGQFPEVSVEQFQKQLEHYYQHPAACALGGKKRIQNAALISGGAHRNIIEAVAENCDCYITGSHDEPVWHQAFEEKINFFALGHSATERVGPKALGEHLEGKFGIQGIFIDPKNPF